MVYGFLVLQLLNDLSPWLDPIIRKRFSSRNDWLNKFTTAFFGAKLPHYISVNLLEDRKDGDPLQFASVTVNSGIRPGRNIRKVAASEQEKEGTPGKWPHQQKNLPFRNGVCNFGLKFKMSPCWSLLYPVCWFLSLSQHRFLSSPREYHPLPKQAIAVVKNANTWVYLCTNK